MTVMASPKAVWYDMLTELTVDAVSVEVINAALNVKVSPKAVWHDRFTVDRFSELRLTALTEDVVSVE